MIRQITDENAAENLPLLDEMFQARKRLFHDRLGWDVTIDSKGREKDAYDTFSPLYLISIDDRNRHRGSLRLLPTTGKTMLRDHFASVFDGMAIDSPRIWECTRFCVDRDTSDPLTHAELSMVTNELLLGMSEIGRAYGLSKIAGLCDHHAFEVYQQAGWAPHVIGQSGTGKNAVFLSMWDVTNTISASIRKTGGIVGSILETPAPKLPHPTGAA